MKILIIDSHKGSDSQIPQNLHWKNAKLLADHFEADLIWSYPSCNNEIKSDYDVIIFVHASHYSYVDYKWLEQSPNAKLIYITNEYNLGEPRILWTAAKQGRQYDVIANHPNAASKVVMKYVKEWNIVNLNSIIFNPIKQHKQGLDEFFQEDSVEQRNNTIYYGSFRKGREKYFAKYLTDDVVLSTHSKNEAKFRSAGVTSPIVKRISWDDISGLFPYKMSLYMEDEITHEHYNHLANRFYEALNYGCIPLFTEECRRTTELSGYDICDDYFITDSSEIMERTYLSLPQQWLNKAAEERRETMCKIGEIIYANI